MIKAEQEDEDNVVLSDHTFRRMDLMFKESDHKNLDFYLSDASDENWQKWLPDYRHPKVPANICKEFLLHLYARTVRKRFWRFLRKASLVTGVIVALSLLACHYAGLL